MRTADALIPFAGAQSRPRGALNVRPEFHIKSSRHTIHSGIGAETVTANRDRVGELTVAPVNRFRSGLVNCTMLLFPGTSVCLAFHRASEYASILLWDIQSCYGQLLCQPHFGLRHQHLISNCSYPWPRRPDLRRRPIGRRCFRTPSSDPVLAAVTPNTGNGSISVFPAALSRHGGTRRHPPTECAEAADGATPRNSGHSTTSRALVSLGLIEGIVCDLLGLCE